MSMTKMKSRVIKFGAHWSGKSKDIYYFIMFIFILESDLFESIWVYFYLMALFIVLETSNSFNNH